MSVEPVRLGFLATLRSIVNMGLRERFGGCEPDRIGAVLEAITDIKSARRLASTMGSRA